MADRRCPGFRAPGRSLACRLAQPTEETLSAAEAFLSRVLDIAFEGQDMGPEEAADVQWIAGLSIAAHALRQSDPFTRERLLRGVEDELRSDLAGIERIEQRRQSTPESAA